MKSSEPATSAAAGVVPSSSPAETESQRWWSVLASGRWGRRITLTIAGLAIAAGMATYGALTESLPFDSSPSSTLILLNIDLVLLLLLGAIVASGVVRLWAERRRGAPGSRLHVRFVLLFSVLAALPTIIVSIFSALFLDLGLQSWFSRRVGTVLDQSLAVAEAYLKEHQQVIRADALAMANDLNRDGPAALLTRPAFFGQIVNAQAAIRSLSEVTLFTGNGDVLARAGRGTFLDPAEIQPEVLEQARQGEVVVMLSDKEDQVRALLRLDRFFDTYLFVGRAVDAQALGHMERTRALVADYKLLEGQRSGYQITFTLIFVVIALLVLLAAIWIGLVFATRLAKPLSSLVTAAERVRAGDLSVQVAETQDADEIGVLSRSFNRMINQLEGQRAELIDANRQSETRRRFTEAVLGGVSAGVIGLDSAGHVHYPNRSASDLLGVDLNTTIGRQIGDIVPAMGHLVDEARRQSDRPSEQQIEHRRGDETRILLVRVAAEREGKDIRGFVVTFDDITELLAAQRKAAWGDVARRIAHEIKNPLTPIQLSAERLKRKYLDQIDTDRDTFVICTDTIVRHVTNIGRMVDEFSAFARMPAPIFRLTDLRETCRQAVFLEAGAEPAIDFQLDVPDEPVRVSCDPRQVAQALTNLLRNAVHAIDGRAAAEGEVLPPGHIAIRLQCEQNRTSIIIEDNGKGLPAELKSRLTEPYVTTRERGTGLGLAIVKKIMEDHGGEIRLRDREGGGAEARLVFPVAAIRTAAPQLSDAQPRDSQGLG